MARRALFRSSAERDNIARGTGLPCAANPSDHVPVGAVFAWRRACVTATSSDFPIGEEGAEPGAVSGAVSTGGGGGGGGDRGGDGGDRGGGGGDRGGDGGDSGGGTCGDMSLLPDLRSVASQESLVNNRRVGRFAHLDVLTFEEAMAEADALLAACPLTDAERAEFESASLSYSPETIDSVSSASSSSSSSSSSSLITASAAALPSERFASEGHLVPSRKTSTARARAGRAKPSADEVVFLRRQRARRETLLASVSAEARAMLEAVGVLRRRALELQRMNQKV